MAQEQPRNAGKFVKRDESAPIDRGGIDRKIDGNGIAIVNPGEAIGNTIAGDTDSRPEKRGPGRPAGKTKVREARKEKPFSPGEKREALDVEFLNKVLFGIHKGVATLTKIPELEIDEGESKMLADATSQLLAEYEITITARQKAWYHFYGALSMVYGTRIAIFAMKKKTVAPVQPKQSQGDAAGEQNGGLRFL